MKIGVSGSGSIGKRHIKNAIKLGVEKEDILVFEPREDRRDEIKPLGVKLFDNFEEFSKQEFEGAIIASPTSLHAEQSIILAKNNKNLLIEKPIDSDIQKCNLLKEIITDMKLNCLIGYCFRFAEYSIKLKELINKKVVGQPFHVRGEFSEYLPDWHPYEDYRSFYMAKKDLGGGSLLDQSHIIDLCIWLFGDIESVFGQFSKISNLEVETDDYTNAIINFKNGVKCFIHQDMFGRDKKKEIEIKCENGNLSWNAYDLSVGQYDALKNKNYTHSFEKDHQIMYLNEMKHFFNLIKNPQETSIASIDDGIDTVRVINAIKDSQLNNKLIKF